LHHVFNISRLKLYVSSSTAFATRPQRYERPPPEADADTNGEALWQVDSVLACKKVGRGKRYLVAWKGYPPEENTWEPHASISHTAAFEEFQAMQQHVGSDNEQAEALSSAAALTQQAAVADTRGDEGAAVMVHVLSSGQPSKKSRVGHTKPPRRSHQPLRDRRTPQAPPRRIRQATTLPGHLRVRLGDSVIRARGGF
jgi:hypothetical protein